jgi:16S rRNA (guanine966-N2)-methyltransferase
MRRIKVTGGDLRSRSIEILEHTEARYTPSKVREAIFNIIGSVEGKRVLDLFAGSGSFAIEALSRGARGAALVEKNPEMCALIRRNLDSLSLLSSAEILNMEVGRALPFLYKSGVKYDIIFMDPPYNKGHVKETAALFRVNELVSPDGFFVIEHSKKELYDGPESWGGKGAFTRRYGNTCLTIYEPLQDTTERSL